MIYEWGLSTPIKNSCGDFEQTPDFIECVEDKIATWRSQCELPISTCDEYSELEIEFNQACFSETGLAPDYDYDPLMIGGVGSFFKSENGLVTPCELDDGLMTCDEGQEKSILNFFGDRDQVVIAPVTE